MEFLLEHSGLIESLPDPPASLLEICPEGWELDQFKQTISVLAELNEQEFSYWNFHASGYPFACLQGTDLKQVYECAGFLCLPVELLQKIDETKEILETKFLSKTRWNQEFNWDPNNTECWAVVGDVRGMQYAHENGCHWNEETCRWAAFYGHFECLKYAHENGCPWDSDTCNMAAYNGHIGCLKYAYENGCPWDVACMAGLIRKRKIDEDRNK